MKPVSSNDLLRFFFIAGGRIGRQEYALGIAFIYAVDATLIAFALHQADHDLALGLVLMVITFPTTVALLVLAAKRCHDIGLSGVFAVAVLVPFFGLLWQFALALIAGNPDPNRHGPPPRLAPD